MQTTLTSDEAAEHLLERQGEVLVAGVHLDVHLPEVGRAIHAHLHVHGPSSGRGLLRRRLAPGGGRGGEGILPVVAHGRPSNHLRFGGRRRGGGSLLLGVASLGSAGALGGVREGALGGDGARHRRSRRLHGHHRTHRRRLHGRRGTGPR
uniref:Uncharacterized protein n=1 Tax=Zea mays TaxID=4577 RepID=C0PB89_MAIZE|nr:unknown [Zea mays]